MAIDTGIFQLQQDPLQQYQRALALKNAISQQQMQAQQLQGAQLGNQEKQQQLNGQQALDQAMSQAFTKGSDGSLSINKDAVVNSLTSRGAGHLVPGVLKNFNDMDKAAADLKEAQLKAKAAGDDYTANSLLSIYDSKYDPSIAIGTIAHARDAGAIPPQQAVALADQITANPTPENVKAIIDPLLSRSPAFQKLLDSRKTAQGAQDRGDAAKTQAGIAQTKLDVEKPGLEVDAAQKQRADLAAKLGAATSPAEYQQILGEIPLKIAGPFIGKTPAQARQLGMSAEQQTQASQAATNAQNTEADRKQTLAQGAQRIGLESQRIGIENQGLQLRNQEYQQKYGDVLGQMPDATRSMAEKVANGDMSVAQLSRLPNKEQIVAGAIQINPAWTAMTYDTKQSFTNPEKSQAKNLGTISRIVGHIGRFEDNSQKLGFAPLYASGMTLTGPQAALREDSHAISAELEKLVSGGVATENQAQAWQKGLSSPSVAARQAAVDELSKLIGSQYEGMSQTYKAGTGQDLPVAKYVNPAGQQWLKAKGINVTGAATPAAASNVGAGKSVTRQDVQDYAAKHKLSYADAESHVKANGFTVK